MNERGRRVAALPALESMFTEDQDAVPVRLFLFFSLPFPEVSFSKLCALIPHDGKSEMTMVVFKSVRC